MIPNRRSPTLSSNGEIPAGARGANAAAPLLIARLLAALLLAGCGDMNAPEHTKAPAGIGIAFVGAGAVESADSIRFTLLDTAHAVLIRRAFSFGAREAVLPAIACDRAHELFIEGFDLRGRVCFHGMIALSGSLCDSPRIRIGPADITPPTPRDLHYRVTAAGAVALHWRADADSFMIERADREESAFAMLAAVYETGFTDSLAAPGSACRYRITAINAAGASPALCSPEITIPAPDNRGPSLALLSHSVRDTVGDSVAVIFGSASDPAGLLAILVNDSAAGRSGAIWHARVHIVRDSLPITLRAIDSSANETMLRATLWRSPGRVDTTAPTIIVVSPEDSAAVTSERINLAGAVSDPGGVESFTINDSAVSVDGFLWSVDSIALSPGANRFRLTALDNSANRTERLVTVFYRDPCVDAAPPRVRLLSHTMIDTVNTRIISLHGSAGGPNGIASITLDSMQLAVTDGLWEAPGLLLRDTLTAFCLVATDTCDQPRQFADTIRIRYIPSYVEPGNHAPLFTSTAASLAITIKAGDTLRQTLAARDPDPYDRLSFACESPLLLEQDSVVVWPTRMDDIGSRLVRAQVYDQDSACDSLAWTVTVADPRINTPPSFVTGRSDMLDSIMVGDTYIDTIRAADLDQVAGLRYRLVDGPADVLIGLRSGVVTWQPAANLLGLHVLTAEAVDDSGALDRLTWAVRVFDPSLPAVNAGRDTTVSINDTVNLDGGAESATGAIAAYAWDIGGTGVFTACDSGDTVFRAPDSAVATFVCVLRATDTYNRRAVDTMIVRVVADPPIAEAGPDQVAWLGEQFDLAPAAADSFGAVVRWEWDIGATGAFTLADSGIFTGVAPSTAGPLVCVLRVTDDDHNEALDSLTVHIVGGAMRLIEPAGARPVLIGGDRGAADEAPAHWVRIDPFLIDTTEITQREYHLLMSRNPSTFANPAAPVEGVTWYDAALFCNERSKRDGYDTIYAYSGITGTPGEGAILSGLTIRYGRIGYRLPTEAEWETAGAPRTMHDSLFYWGDDTAKASLYAWFESNAQSRTRAVAQRIPNGHDLYDMAGNVWEWCNDWYDAGYYAACAAQDTVENPTGPSSGAAKIIRGGSWQDPPDALRTSRRGMGIPSWSSGFVGFRCILPTIAVH